MIQCHEVRDKSMAHKEGIDYHETFSPVSKNGSSR